MCPIPAPRQAKTMARLCPGHRGAWQEGEKELEREIKGRWISALLLLRFVALLPAPLQLRLLCTAGHGAAASSWSEMFVGPSGQPGAVGTPQPLGSLWGHGAAPSHPPFFTVLPFGACVSEQDLALPAPKPWTSGLWRAH